MNSRPQQRPLRRQQSFDAGYRLRIDTTGERGNAALIDRRGRVFVRLTFPLDPPSPGALLRAIDALCRSSGVKCQMSGVSVVPGPGRFSRVRLGIVTANALAWALGVPLFVRGKRVRVATPEYGAEPHIGSR